MGGLIGGGGADWGGRKQRISQVECWGFSCRTAIWKMDRTQSGMWFRFPVLSSALLLSVQKRHPCPAAFRIFSFCGKRVQNEKGRTNALPYTCLKSWVDCTILRLPPVQLVLSIPTTQHKLACLKQHQLNNNKK